jgi:hypothetical protein
MTTKPPRLDDLINYVTERQPDGDALAQLSDAAATSVQLGELADHLVGHFVDQARLTGATWTEIGGHMGVSKQAAQKRFVPRADGEDDPDFPVKRGLSRFTKRARNVLREAKAQAAERGDSEILNEHLVLGLLSEPDGLAATAIMACGPSLDQVRGAMLAGLGSGHRKKISRGQAKFSRAAKKTIELSLREALRLDHNYIGTEHLLLGLLRNDQERAGRLLEGLDVTRETVERSVTAEIAAIKASRP